MISRERIIPYVTIRTFSDPTAFEAIGRRPDNIIRPATLHDALINQLRDLERERRSRRITRRGFEQERASLLALSVVLQKGG